MNRYFIKNRHDSDVNFFLGVFNSRKGQKSREKVVKVKEVIKLHINVLRSRRDMNSVLSLHLDLLRM